MPQSTTPVRYLAGMAGASAGAVVGTMAFLLLARLGLFAMALPGALIGLGCGYASRSRSLLLGLFCGLCAAPLSIALEWRRAPFIKDDSFGFFLSHLTDLKPVTLALMAVGVLFAVWFGTGRNFRAKS